MRPGCGSLSVDPDLVDELRVRFEGGRLHSRRIELAELEDEFEAMFARGWTDGLPVVPPTEERVLRMLEGTTRDAQDIVATVPPDLVDVTVEKVAIAAVMAGCLPEYLPWVLTAVEAICNDEFNIHGVLATTMPVGPVIVCSGPGTQADRHERRRQRARPGQPGQPDDRAGRAARRAQRRRRPPAGRRPGRPRQPGQALVLLLRAPRLAVHARSPSRRGATPGVDALTVFAGEGPRCVVDQKSRDAREPRRSRSPLTCRRCTTPSWCSASTPSSCSAPSTAGCSHEAGWDRDRIVARAHRRRRIARAASSSRGAGGIAEGLPERLRRRARCPKFRADGILLGYAGGGAGLFSAIIGGWANGAMGSTPVTREVRP